MKNFCLSILITSLMFDPLALAQVGHPLPTKKGGAPAVLPQPGGTTLGTPMPGGVGTLQPPVFPNYPTGVMPPTLVGQPALLGGQPLGYRTPALPPPPQMQVPFALQPPPPGYQYCNPSSYNSGYGGSGGYNSMPTSGGSGIGLCPDQRRNLLPMLIMPLMLMSTLGHGGGGFGGGGFGGSGYGGGGYGGGYGGYAGEIGSGVLEPCGVTPPEVNRALREAEEFRSTCAPANRGPNQKIVINDYSNLVRPPQMFIFDSGGRCLRKTAATFGNGQVGPGAKPIPCANESSHLTPPGFHLTAYHSCGRTSRGAWDCKIPPDRSLALVGLEGQDSRSRGILIHPANAPGTASSWGCTGVGPFQAVKRLLGYGSLVYNYFGNTAPGCRNPAGLRRRCVGLDGGAQIPDEATGESADAVACFNF